MSTAPVIPAQSDDASELSRDQWWAPFDQRRLAQQPAYAEVDGPITFVRHERKGGWPTH